METIPLGAFQLLEPIGEGGMGQVWRGVHAAQGLPVAVKLLTGERMRQDWYRAAFRREVQAVASLYHSGIVTVFDLGEVDAGAEKAAGGRLVAGAPFLAMEWVPGGWLSPAWRPATWPRLAALLLDILSALAHAHARNVIHRDLKPENILVVGADARGRLRTKLSDFGIAYALEPAVSGAETARARPGTTEGLVGTPAYMAPEQCRGHWRDYGPWTDLYALGCVAFELATGRPPFGTEVPQRLVRAHIEEPVPPLAPRFEVPPAFESWVSRLLEKRALERFSCAADAASGLLRLEGPAGEAVPLFPRPAEVGPAFHEATAAAGPTHVPLTARAPEAAGGVDDPSAWPAPAPALAPTVRAASTGPPGEWATTVAQPPPEATQVTPGAPHRASMWPTTPLDMPSDWRAAGDVQPAALAVGLKLFGLRAIPLVDRERERDLIWNALAHVHEQRRPRAVLLQGPAGVGKSRIAEWAVERAHEVAAAETLRAVHSPRRGPGDGLPGAIERYFRCAGLPRPVRTRRTERILRGAGATDELEWLTVSELMAPPGEEAPDGLRIHFAGPTERLEAMWRPLARIARLRPLIVWLDDVQWGAESIELVRYGLTTPAWAGPILLLLTCREEALAERPGEAEQLERLVALDGVDRAQLGPLQRGDQRALVLKLLQLEPPLAERIVERTHGNPLFAVQLMGDWVQRGVLELAEAGFRLREGEAAELPDSIHAVWLARIEQLMSELAALRGEREAREAEQALELGAALGLQVSWDEWLRACQACGAEPPYPLFEALVVRRLAVVRDERTWAFVHGMFRESIERRAREGGRWARLNATCADVLAEQRGHDDPVLAERLAGHQLAAHDFDRAVTSLLEAAGTHLRSGANALGLALLSEARKAMQAGGIDVDDARTGQADYWTAVAAFQEGRRDEAHALIEALTGMAARHGWRQILADASRFLGKCERDAGHLERAERLAKDALRLHQALGDRHGQAMDLASLGELAFFRGEAGEADRLSEQAAALYERDNRPVGMANCLRIRGCSRLQRGDPEGAKSYLQQALALSQKVGNRRGVAIIFNDLGECARGQGDLAEAERCYREAASLLESLGLAEAVVPQTNLALNLLWAGRLKEGANQLRAVCVELERLKKGGLLGVLQPALMMCAAVEADWAAWDRHYERALEPAGQVEADTARFAEEAARRAFAAGQSERARDAWTLAAAYWRQLGLQDRAAAVQAQRAEALGSDLEASATGPRSPAARTPPARPASSRRRR